MRGTTKIALLAVISLSVASGISSAEAQAIKRPPKPTQECLDSTAALFKCLEDKTITQEQYDFWLPVAMNNEDESEVIAWQRRVHWLKVPHRCEHDSLNSKAARARNDWSEKCMPYNITEISKFVKSWASEDIARPHYLSWGFFHTHSSGEIEADYRYGFAPVASIDVPAKRNPEDKLCNIGRGNPNIKGGHGMPILEAKYSIVSTCVSSCYTPEQEVTFSTGEEAILEASQAKRSEVVTLSSASSMSSVNLTDSKIRYFVESDHAVDHDIVDIETKSGKKLRVTTNHPLLTKDGVMKDAGELEVGDLLVNESGAPEAITKLKKSIYNGKVHNLFVDSEDPLENIVVAQGLLNGSAYYQNQGANLMNRVILRLNIQEVL